MNKSLITVRVSRDYDLGIEIRRVEQPHRHTLTAQSPSNHAFPFPLGQKQDPRGPKKSQGVGGSNDKCNRMCELCFGVLRGRFVFVTLVLYFSFVIAPELLCVFARVVVFVFGAPVLIFLPCALDLDL